MKNSKVLVIDDSSTIRRLASKTLSSAGYQVILAENAEEGIRFAKEETPDLILLDHQLPGTTGVHVCGELLEDENVRTIPIIVSSTLRKRAYVEYADCSNVIDMLPKPYNEELLTSTVEHALSTGAMVVNSQAGGTAVPEVINQMTSSELVGDLSLFSLREVLDFLNNSMKTGVVEAESSTWRVRFYIAQGRVQAVTSNGIDQSIVTETLPNSLSSLAPVLKLAITGRDESELDGLVQLLNNKVLDPRLLGRLLRHQAAMLAFTSLRSDEFKEFRFEASTLLPPLFRDLPLNVSLAALAVEGALSCDGHGLPENSESIVWSRRTIRGQNLDRAGMSARHQRIVALLSQPLTICQISKTLGWEDNETLRVVYGLSLVQLFESKVKDDSPTIIILETDADHGREVRDTIDNKYQVRVVKDLLSLQLVLRRENPYAVVVPLSIRETDIAKRLSTDSKVKQVIYGESTDQCALSVKFTAAELVAHLEQENSEIACSL